MVSASLEHLFGNDNLGLVKDLHNFLCFFNPLYPLMGCLDCITKVGLAVQMLSRRCTSYRSASTAALFLCLQASYLTSHYEENSLWKNLLISVITVWLSF